MTAVARDFRLFARREARGRSAVYESLAESAAGDAVVTDFVASLPADKRQPNLLFAAARYLAGAATRHPAAPRAGHPVSRASWNR